MPRLSFLFRTDTHVADKSPASWKGDYPAEIWSNLEQIGGFAKAHDVTAVLDGGDFFHVKAASRTSHGAIFRTAEIHKAYPCPTFCIEGNHDVPFNNLELIDRQPLGVLYSCGVFQHLREQVFRDGDLQVRVVGVPYQPKRSLADLLSIQKKPGDDFLIAVVHALASENHSGAADDFFNEPVFRYADLASQDGPDVWMFGHWHRDQGVVKVLGKHFVNQGAVSRGALTHENLARVPQVSLIEFEKTGPTITTIPLIVAPASEVFDLEKKERADAEIKNIDSFLEVLQADVEFDSAKSIDENLLTMDVATDVREMAMHYLSQVREG